MMLECFGFGKDCFVCPLPFFNPLAKEITMNLEEAIKTSLEYENNVADVYKKYADKFSSEVGKKIFKTLGKEEEDHVAYLESKLEQWQKTGKVTVDNLKTTVPNVEDIKKNVKKLKKVAKQEGVDNEIEYFEKALEMEIKTSNFYKQLVKDLPAEDKELFVQFIEIEEGHEAIVRAEIDNARGLGFWFDYQEFDLEVA
jgi:rubrerythrin